MIEALGKRLGGGEFFGCGGDRMRAAGCQTLVDARQLAMVGIVEVLPGLPRAWRALQLLKNSAKKERPALAILVDFPDFNLRLAKELKRLGTPVVYFVAPQVWAWRPGRLKTLRRNVDRLLCIFPFEEAFFKAGGIEAEFVGHPLVTRVAPSLSAEGFRARFGLPEATPLVALLPGSRRREIELNLPPLIETALLGTPMVVVYRVSRATWLLGSGLVHTPYYSMVNIVAGQRIVPEFIQDTESWRKLEWYPYFDRARHPDKTTLFNPRPGSYVLIFPRAAR